jgi:hypothetical protein
MATGTTLTIQSKARPDATSKRKTQDDVSAMVGGAMGRTRRLLDAEEVKQRWQQEGHHEAGNRHHDRESIIARASRWNTPRG